jgi:two-component system, OmpR family, response regulator
MDPPTPSSPSPPSRPAPAGPNGAPARVLVVDDERNITDLVATALRFVGYDVTTASGGREALDRAASATPDLVVLDVLMPDYDGFEVCRRLRADGIGAPVIFLTARDATEDKVAGLRLGADDYLTKPFSLEELIARIEVVLRRTAGERRPGGDPERLALADLELDVARHEVRRSGELVNLSPTEFRLLRYLMVNTGRVLSKGQLLDHVWGYDAAGDTNVVETYISYLRRKIDHLGVPLIHTVRGVGYTLRLPPGGS